MNGGLYHLLFIDDDMDFLQSMQIAVSSSPLTEGNGLEIESHFLNDPREALAFTQELAQEDEKIAVIVSDQQMPDLTGLELIEKANNFVPKTIKMLLTGYASLDSAKYAINHHILHQYISKPIEDYDHFTCLIKNAVKTFHSLEENERAQAQIRHYVKELEEKNQKIKNLQQAAEKVAYLAQGFRKLDMDEVLDLIINQLPGVFNAKCASLFLYDEDTNRLDMVRSNYLDEPFKLKVDERGATPMMIALKENRVIILPQIRESSLEFMGKEVLGDACIIIPFILGENQTLPDFLGSFDKISGVLNMASISDMEPDYIVRYTASLIKNIMGINILNAKLYQKTQQLALFDGMTGLYNKQMFAEFLTKERDYSERHGVPFYLAMIDVDDFKSVNDTHGHRIGDEVIVHLGRAIKEAARASDVLARYGGDEFAWILRCPNESEVIRVLDRFRAAIAHSPWPRNISLTASIGFSRYSPQSGDSIKELVDRADAALYQVKNNEKNGVKGK
jgi:diguanylate cyclase (GGDEF)-like protein